MTARFNCIEDYFSELNSKHFRAGVDAALEETLGSGNETGFEVRYHKEYGFIYPDEILIGTKEGVGESIHTSKVDKLFKEKTRKEVKDIDFTDKSLYDAYLETIREVTLPYPQKKGYQSLTSIILKGGRVKGNSRILIDFHTHPSSIRDRPSAAPSPFDLKRLSYLKNDAYPTENNPLSLIFQQAPRSNRSNFLYTIIQQKKSLSPNSNFEGMSILLSSMINPKEWSLLSDIFDLNKDAASERLNEIYSFKTGTYHIDKGFISKT